MKVSDNDALKMITKASLIIEYDGGMYAVLLDGIDLDSLVNAVAGLNGSGKIQVVKLDECSAGNR